MRKTIFVFLFLIACSFAAAAIVHSDFTTGVTSAAHFATDMRIESNMDCAYTGEVLEGTPCSGVSTVCPGGDLWIIPSTSGVWARSYADIVSSYSYCSGTGYCPSMIDYSTLNTNRYIKWMDDGTFDDYDVSDGSGHAEIPLRIGTEGIERYDELRTFYTQRMSYFNVSGGTIYPNKRGEANVFCNGNVDVRVNGVTRETQPIESPRITVVSLPTEGTRTVQTRLAGVNCFAAAVKHPLDRDRPDYFIMLLYGYNAPSIPTVSSGSFTVNVENKQPGLRDTSVDIYESSTIDDLYLLAITVRNTGDVAVRVTGVESPSTAVPFGTGMYGGCSFLGIPSPPCPSDNGFNDTISVGGSHTVYVTYSGSLSTTITLTYEPLEEICGDETEFELDVRLFGDIVDCEIEPPTLDAGPYEVHDYEVTCYNFLGEEVPCAGTNWYWGSGLSGDFLARTSSYAWAYTTSSPGTSGTLCYSPDIMTFVECCADVTSSTVFPYFMCELDPSSADLEVGDTQWFDLNAYMSGSPIAPVSADYDAVEGLSGLISSSSIYGTNFTGTTASAGRLRAFAERHHHGDPTLEGAVCFADINVGNVTGNETVPDGGTEEDNIVCELDPDYREKYPHDGDYVGILCGEPGDREPCSSTTDVRWSILPELYGSVDGTYAGARYRIGTTGDPAYGLHPSAVRATIFDDGTAVGSCSMNIFIKEPTCLEYS